jgi:hypothetical protein
MYLALKHSTAASSSRGGGANIQHLQPATKTLALNRSIGLHASMGTLHQENQSRSFASSLSSSINRLSERLYRTAAVQKEKLDRVRKAEEESTLKELREGKFKLSDASRALVENYKTTSTDDITLRLYDDGCKDLEKRKKMAAAHPEPAALETWSCVKCGTFHTLPLKTGADQKKAGSAAPRKCNSCGWETSGKGSIE